MVLAYCFYTSDIVTMNITAKQNSNLLPPDYLKTHALSDSEISARHYGSVMTMVVSHLREQRRLALVNPRHYFSAPARSGTPCNFAVKSLLTCGHRSNNVNSAPSGSSRSASCSCGTTSRHVSSNGATGLSSSSAYMSSSPSSSWRLSTSQSGAVHSQPTLAFRHRIRNNAQQHGIT